MVAMQLPVAIGFCFEQIRFPSHIQKPAFEYPNNQRVLLLPSNHSLINGVLFSSKEGWFTVIHRIEWNGVSLNSTSAAFKFTILPNQSSSMVESLEFHEASETLVLVPWFSSPNLSVSLQFILKWYQHMNWMQAEHTQLSQTCSQSQHEPYAEIEPLMLEGQHHQVNCWIITTLF